MRSIKYIALALMVLACTKPDNPNRPVFPTPKVELSLCDANATPATKALYSNLWAIQEKGFMFGHHDDLVYGRYWYNEPGRSDTKDVCGDYPAVFSVDLAELDRKSVV